MGQRNAPQAVESSFAECKVSISRNDFCKKMKESNSIAFEKATNGKGFIRALNLTDVKLRIKKANEISKKWKNKISQ
jgi:hypothetical protein